MSQTSNSNNNSTNLDYKLLYESMKSDTVISYSKIAYFIDSLSANDTTPQPTKEGYFDRYNAWKNFYENRLDSLGNLNTYFKALKKEMGFKCNFQDSPKWRSLGPSGNNTLTSNNIEVQSTGRVTNLWSEKSTGCNDLVDEIGFMPQRILAGAWGGLWETTDGGENWNCITNNSGLSYFSPSAIEVDPLNPNKIWIGTNVNDQYLNTSYGFGVGVMLFEPNTPTPGFQRVDNINRLIHNRLESENFDPSTGMYPLENDPEPLKDPITQIIYSPHCNVDDRILFVVAKNQIFYSKNEVQWFLLQELDHPIYPDWFPNSPDYLQNVPYWQYRWAHFGWTKIMFVPNNPNCFFITGRFPDRPIEIYRVLINQSSGNVTFDVTPVNIPDQETTNNALLGFDNDNMFIWQEYLDNNIQRSRLLFQCIPQDLTTLGTTGNLHSRNFNGWINFSCNDQGRANFFLVSRHNSTCLTNTSTDIKTFYFLANQSSLVTATINLGTSTNTQYEFNDEDCYERHFHTDVRDAILLSSPTSIIPKNDVFVIATDGGVSLKHPSHNAPGIIENIRSISRDGLNNSHFWNLAQVETRYKMISGGMIDNGNLTFDGQNWMKFQWGDNYNTYIDYSQTDANQHPVFWQRNRSGGGPKGTGELHATNNFGLGGNIFGNSYLGPSLKFMVINKTQQYSYLGNDQWVGPTNNEVPVVNATRLHRINLTTTPTTFTSINFVNDLGVSSPINGKKFSSITLANENNNSELLYFSLKPQVWDDFETYSWNSGLDKLYRGQMTNNGNDCAIRNITPQQNPSIGEIWQHYTDIALAQNSTIGDDEDDQQIWVTLGGLKHETTTGTLIDNSQRVLFSPDGGTTWVDRSFGLTGLPVNAITYHKGSDDVLYCATDIGVYKWVKNPNSTLTSDGADAGEWVCFMNGLPSCIITDIDINYCGQMLRVSTWGQGMWECDLPTLPELVIGDGLSHITVVWDEDKTIETDVRVKPLTTLVINNNAIINMARGKRIIVEKGAKLYVENATLTNACEAMWGGIDVHGSETETQDLLTNNPGPYGFYSNQGYAYFNNAIVEHAREALRIWNPDATDGSIGSGGIVQAIETQFINNRRSAEFRKYQYTNGNIKGVNKSFFTNCSFETNDAHSMDHPFYAHVTMWGTYWVRYKGCSFMNNKTNLTNPLQMGSGIYTIDASYPTRACTFQNLSYGLLSDNATSSLNYVICEGNTFRDNYRGVELSYAPLSIVQDNEFYIGDLPLSNTNMAIGIAGSAIRNTPFFKHYNNLYYPSNSAKHLFTIGSWFRDNGEVDNVSTKNSYNNIPFSNLVNGINRSGNGFTGLNFSCNPHIGVSHYDFSVTGDNDPLTFDGVREIQGNIDPSTSQSISAGNEFNQVSCASNPNCEGHFFNGSSRNVRYYWLNPNEEPMFFTTTTVIPIVSNLPSECSTVIEDDGEGGGYKKMSSSELNEQQLQFATNKLSKQYYVSLLQNLIDGGNTEELKEDVENTNQTQALHQKLLGESPFLSAEVLKEAADQTDVLPDAILFEIFSNNPDGLSNEELLRYLENKAVPMPSWMINVLRTYKGTITYRTLLEMGVSFHSAAMTHAARLVLEDFARDSAIDHQADMISWLSSFENFETDVLVAAELYKKGQQQQAENLINSLPQLHRLNTYQIEQINDQYNFLTLQDPISSLYEPNTTQKLHIKQIADGGKSRAQQQSRAYLKFFAEEPYVEDPEFPNVSTSSKTDVEVKDITEAGLLVQAFPNPATYYVSFQWQLPIEPKAAYIVMYDFLGSEVAKVFIDKMIGQNTIETTKLNTGLYTYTLFSHGMKLQSGKFTVQQ